MGLLSLPCGLPLALQLIRERADTRLVRRLMSVLVADVEVEPQPAPKVRLMMAFDLTGSIAAYKRTGISGGVCIMPAIVRDSTRKLHDSPPRERRQAGVVEG
jgi:hypothetical protein